MVSRIVGSVALAVVLSNGSRAQDEIARGAADVPPILPIGAHAPPFSLPGIDGKTHSLEEYASSRVLAIVFTCDHCPVAQMYEKRIKQLTTDYSSRGVAIVAINPNDPKAVHLSEMGHTDLGDSIPDMKIRAEYRHFTFPYLSDGATQAAALKYGPTATPHVFIFDEQRNLQYEGRIDSNAREELAAKHEARDAIDALLAGRPVAVKSTPAVGCSTKWAYKEAGAKAEIDQSDRESVGLDTASVEGIKALRTVPAPGKLRLVNFWATWCEPCLEEFPELQTMVRMYRKRALEIVTVSLNNPDEQRFVRAFLDEHHAINRNLLFSGTDPADAVSAFGTEWAGGLPYTVLLGMSGEVLFRTQGRMNALDVRRAILKNVTDDRYVGQHAYWNSTF